MQETLPEVLERHGVSLPAEQTELLDRYCRELWSWNEKLNLTRHTDYEKFVTRDLRDSCELAALLADGEEVLDLGSGGGVPGIVLSILRPDLQLTLCDSVGKKAKALTSIIESLELPVAVHGCRAEELLEEFRYHSVVARAVGPLDKILTWLADRWGGFDRLLAIKGPRWPEEKNEAARRGLLRGLSLNTVASYPLPGTESNSVILEVRRAT